VGQAIVALRDKFGVSQGRVADAVGVDQSTISRVEGGERALSVSELTAMARFFGVDPAAILVKNETGLVALREDPESTSTEARGVAFQLFRSIIRDYFGAEALAK
jgi:transcriptional regulator with XRE-family HTH domain